MMYSDFTLKWATLPWELAQARALRRRVFCDEQGIFDGEDIDARDESAITIVAIGNQGGWHQDVVGTVRINHEGDNIWSGSRLAVDRALRGEGAIGSGLIRLAVSSAHARGCRRFTATVQAQNERLFQRLHWVTREHCELYACRHAVMEADLQRYPPFAAPEKGFVLKPRRAPRQVDVWPGLLAMPAPRCAHTAGIHSNLQEAV